jgi:hypothetical protein
MKMNNTGILLSTLTIAALAILGIYALNTPDTRSTGEHISDAVSKLDDGVDDAARELEDRTPLERAKDEVNDATDGSPD